MLFFSVGWVKKNIENTVKSALCLEGQLYMKCDVGKMKNSLEAELRPKTNIHQPSLLLS